MTMVAQASPMDPPLVSYAARRHNQPHFMSIKAVCVYLEPHGDPKGSMKLVRELYHASQQFL
jgi:hypothetical protein